MSLERLPLPTMFRMHFFLLIFLPSLVSAFTTSSHHSVQHARLTTFRQPMFSGDEPETKSEASPLVEVVEGESAATETKALESSILDETMSVRNFGRAGEVKEVKWVDPAMSANTNPLKMSLWAYVLFGFPMVLLANDVLHFIPESAKDGPLGFLL